MSERKDVEIIVSGTDAEAVEVEHQGPGQQGMIARGLFWKKQLKL